MPTPTKRAKGCPLNVTATQTVPTSGSAIPITGVEMGKLEYGYSNKTAEADGDQYHTARFRDFNEPTLQLDTIDGTGTFGINPDGLSTIAYQIADSRNGLTAGGGGYSVSGTLGFLDSESVTNQFRDFAKHPIAFKFLSADGVTSPITITPL